MNDYIVPLSIFGLIFLAMLARPIMGIIITTFEIMWIKRDKKFGETDEQWMQRQWDKKENGQILDAYTDAMEWIRISRGRFESPTTKEIADSCQEKLYNYILPQMKKRGLHKDA